MAGVEISDFSTPDVDSLQATTRAFTVCFRSPRHVLEHLRAGDGLAQVAVGAVAIGDAERLAADLLDVDASHSRATDGTVGAPSEYLEVVAVVR